MTTFDKFRNCITEPRCRDCEGIPGVCEEEHQSVSIPKALALDVLELLKEQPEIIRCKDCKNAVVYDGNEVICTHIDSNGNDKHSIDWFCADVERKGE